MKHIENLFKRLTRFDRRDLCKCFTKRYLMNISTNADNEAVKKFFMICAVSAHDSVTHYLDINETTQDYRWGRNAHFSEVKQHISNGLKAYMSCLLLLLGGQKGLIQEKTGLSENEVLARWEKFFEYDEYDKIFFNKLLICMGNNPKSMACVWKEVNSVLSICIGSRQKEEVDFVVRSEAMLSDWISRDAYNVVERLFSWRNVNS